jgi:hypothetical protein
VAGALRCLLVLVFVLVFVLVLVLVLVLEVVAEAVEVPASRRGECAGAGGA